MRAMLLGGGHFGIGGVVAGIIGDVTDALPTGLHGGHRPG